MPKLSILVIERVMMGNQRRMILGIRDYVQFVVITWHKGPSWIERIVSDNPIEIDQVCAHFEHTVNFNAEKDSIEFVSPPTDIPL